MATSDGTVRGAFDLNVGPAVRGVREYRREAAAADVQTAQLGGTMDRTFGREQAAQINTVSDAMGDLSRQTFETRSAVRSEWKGMRSDIEREAQGIIGSIRGVKRQMAELGAMHASPKIDLDGVAEALAQVELLERRLNSLSRQRVTPRVALGGGGGAGGAVARVARSGGGRGGGGSEALRSVGVGPFSLGSRAGLGFIAAGLPAVQALAGGATALAGSLTGATLGTGAVGLSSGGALAAGIASVVAVAKPAQTTLTNAMKAQQKYTESVADYGRKSKQAAVAKREMDQAFGDEKGLRTATRSLKGFTDDWKRLTAAGRSSWYGLLSDIATNGKKVAPQLAGFSNRSTAAVRTSGSAFSSFLTGRETMGTLGTATNQFAKELPTVERTLENITLTAERLYRASAPFFHDANEWVENWTGGLAAGASDIQGTRDRMRELIDEAKDWRDLSGATFDLLRDIFKLSAPSGDSLVVSLTHTMDRWDAWIQSNPGQVKGFFRDTAGSVQDMAKALSGVVGWLNQMSTLLRPLLDRFSQLVGFASSLGLIGAPGSLLALRAGIGSLRGGAGAAGVGGGVLPVGAGGAAAGGGLGMAGLAPALGVSYLAGRGGMATPEAFTQRYGGVSGARYGMPVSALGSRSYGLSRVGGRLAGAGKAAFRAAGPLALGFGALDFASFQGNVGQKFDAGLNSLTFGLTPRPKTKSETSDAAAKYVSGFLDQRVNNLPTTTRGAAKGINAIDSEIDRLSSKQGLTGGQRLLGGGDASFFGLFGTGKGDRLTDQQMAENKDRIGLLKDERDALAKTNEAMRKAAHEREREQKDAQARTKAQRYAGGLQGAFDTYKGAGDDPATALGSTLDQVQSRLKNTRDAGVKTLSQASLDWARAVSKGNPEMKAQVKDLTDSIVDRFKKMGRNVQIVNGNVLTGTKTEWASIRDAMGSATEQAKEKTSSDFTAIQQTAIGSLKSMGFSSGEARSLVTGLEKGGSAAKVAGSVVASGPGGYGDPIPYQAPKKARGGGIIGGRGLMDTVSIGGAMAAPGEAWIANRHTMKDLSMATRAMYGLTAQQMIRGETRRHGQRFATGGLAPAEAGLVGRLGKLGFHPTSTTGGTHAPNSYHYRGMAADYGNSINDMSKLWSVLYPQRSKFAELFGPSSLKPPTLMHFGAGFSDPALQAEHQDHIHVALTGGGGALGKLGSGAGGGGYGRIKVRGLGMRQPGVPGLLRSRAGDIFASALQTKLNKKLSRMGGGGGSLAGFSGGGSSSANMRLGHKMMIAAGFGEDQWPSLKSLWTRESGWSSTARNPSSGAFGIPQSLPASKMGAKAVGGDPAAQIAWGLNYIKGRYGSPSGAMGHENSYGWYARGGPLSERVLGGWLLGSEPKASGGGGSGGGGSTDISSRSGWAQALLERLHDPVTGSNTKALLAWMGAEGGNWNNTAKYNPLNTTLHMKGSHVMAGGSSAGVQAYGSWEQGLDATVKTLRNGYYGSILKVLHKDLGRGALGSAVGGTPWGTGSFARGGKTLDWGGAFANGGSMVTNGPTAFVAGEGHRRRERVTVTPANGRGGGDGMQVTIEKGAVVVRVDGGVKSDADIAALADKVGREVVKKIIESIKRHGTAGVIG